MTSPPALALNPSLLHAAKFGNLRQLKSALRKGADPHFASTNGITALHFAANMGYTDCLSILLPLSDVQCIDSQGRTALHWAARYGHSDSVALLLGSNLPQMIDEHGETALHIASYYGYVDCVSLLLPYSPLHALNQFKETALQLAQMCDRSSCVLLIEAFLRVQSEQAQLSQTLNPVVAASQHKKQFL